LDLSPTNTRLLAGVIAVIVAWRSRNPLLTIASGMAALLLLNLLFSFLGI
jgi:branched-subunit amino acid transport protein